MTNNTYINDVIEIFEQIMGKCGTNYSKVASMIVNDGKPMSRQSIFKMVKGGSLKLSVLFRILDMLDVEVEFRRHGEMIAFRMPKF